MRAARVGRHVAAVSLTALALGACAKNDKDGMGMAKDSGAGMAMAAAPMAPAEYTVIVKSSWTKEHHPFEYPKSGPLTGPHFSGIIGAAHNASYSIFADGSLPTPGLERLSEMGKHQPLDAEINAATAAGSAGPLFETGPLKNFADSLVGTVTVDADHPMVSLVMMVAPSPDWFTGVRNVQLMENGAWVGTKTLDLVAWDSGGDDGTTYAAADKDNNPKKPSSQAATPHFVINGQTVPVGSVTFIKK